MDDIAAVYRYPFESTIDDRGLSLAADSSTGSALFFSGFAEHPRVLAQALLVLGRVSRTRYYVPPGMLARVLRAADPVVTVSPDLVRFEAFSACCGVYARLDLDATGLTRDSRRRGVTNVDINPPLRAALASLRQGEPLHLTVSADALAVQTWDAHVTEERVDLPRRWVRAFAEAQMTLASLHERVRIDATAARHLIRSLPRATPTRSAVWVVPSPGRGFRLGVRAAASGEGVVIAGPERLRSIEPLLAHATGVRAFAADSAAEVSASAWVVDLPGGRFTLALSPEKSRGFSGEGSLLHSLLTGGVQRDLDARRIDDALDAGDIVAAKDAPLGLSADRAQAALAALATAGRLGFDLDEGAFFHRPLPVGAPTLDDIEGAHPRLVDARALAAGGAVTRSGAAYVVTSGDQTYTVRDRGERGMSCTCAWYAAHGSSRGPCKHVLAARLVADAS